MTATYFKPTISFEIPRENILIWDLDDVILCKDYIENYDRLVEKHGQKLIQIFNQYSDETIENEYNCAISIKRIGTVNEILLKKHYEVSQTKKQQLYEEVKCLDYLLAAIHFTCESVH